MTHILTFSANSKRTLLQAFTSKCTYTHRCEKGREDHPLSISIYRINTRSQSIQRKTRKPWLTKSKNPCTCNKPYCSPPFSLPPFFLFNAELVKTWTSV